MNTSALGPEISKFVETLKNAFLERSADQASSATAKTVDQSALRRAVLSLLSSAPRTADQIIDDAAAISAGTWAPTQGEIYPALDALLDEGLLSFQLVASKKVFAISDAGSAWLLNNPAMHHEEPATNTQSNDPKFKANLAARAEFLQAGRLLSQAVVATITSGKNENFELATTELHATAKKLFAALGKAE